MQYNIPIFRYSIVVYSRVGDEKCKIGPHLSHLLNPDKSELYDENSLIQAKLAEGLARLLFICELLFILHAMYNE